VHGFSDPLADHGAWEYDVRTQEIRWSDGVYRIHGLSREDFDPPDFDEIRALVHPEDLESYALSIRSAIADRTPFTIQHRIVRPDGVVRTLLVRGAFLQGQRDRLVGTTQDVTGRQGIDERLWHLANHDPLTGLFNRRRFLEELERELAVARRGSTGGAVLMIDVDRFKDINDTLGHVTGDAVLVNIANALRDRLRATDTLGRLGGDEFALVLPGCPQDAATRLAGEISAAISERAVVRIAGRDRRATASVGVAQFGDGRDLAPDEVLVEADLAMYTAKARGPGEVEAFAEEMRTEFSARLRMEADLRDAIERNEFEIAYQPLVSLLNGATTGCEALLRWNHPRRGRIPPAEFIPVAEEHGLMGRIGAWVLEEACVEGAGWHRDGHEAFVSVNVSAQQLARNHIGELVDGALRRSGLPASSLWLEVAETALLHDISPLVPTLHAVRERGVRVAIDDFGGGTSSLGLLRVLPIDAIKIDRVFVAGLPHRSDDRATVAAAISMAGELGLSVVAEGVEDAGQHRELRELGCEVAQGFLYAKPQPIERVSLDGYPEAVELASVD
jgi:diguanylate cyclase (GGDEF)-like protein/PAS domain S-box-containing protein